AALQPQRRPSIGRPATTSASRSTVTSAPGATPSASSGTTTTPLDPGTVGRTLDNRLAATRQTERAAFVVRWVGLAGALILMGMAIFLLVVFPAAGADVTSPFEGQGRLRALTVLLVLVTVAGELAELPLRAAVEGDVGWSGAVDP